MKKRKVWGTTECLLDTPLCSIHRLYILPWARCSMHRHAHKWNAFYVISGRLTLDTLDIERSVSVPYDLHASDFRTIEPGRLHQFRTHEAGVRALEIYYVEPLSEDIIRLDVGERIDKHYQVGRRSPKLRT
jgi:mannose-6-phosphate isomerase-like protein (cupin superfamily)